MPALGATGAGATGAGAIRADATGAGAIRADAAGAGGTPGVPAQEWWLTSLHVTQAWPATQGSGVTVAVLSTGVAPGHPDLAGSVIAGPDYTGSGRTPGGAFWGFNGTEVAGLIAGHGHGSGDASGIIGVAPAARILSIRVNLEFNDPLNSDAAVIRRLPGAIARGITYAVDHGARVIDLPLDPGTFGLAGAGDPVAAGGSAAERAAVAYALRKDVILVAPAGDDGPGPGIVNYPAGYPGVIAVGAVGRNGQLAAFSSRRSYVSLTAPGVALATAAPAGGYQRISSTSAASGIVAAVAALIVSRFPQLSAAQVTQALTRSTAATAAATAATRPVAGGVAAGHAAAPGTGYGTVNAARAVALAAAISSAGQVRQTATPTATPPKPLQVGVSPHRASASTLAGSLVRDVIAVLGVLIALLVVLLLIMNSRRRRAAATVRARSGQSPGMHAHRRPDRAADPGPLSARPGARRAAGAAPPSAAPSGAAPSGAAPSGAAPSGAAPSGAAPSGAAPSGAAARPQPPQPTAPATSAWPAPGGWQGGSIIGEIAHSAPPSPRPAMTPAPKPAPSRSSRGTAGQRGSASPAGPPWAPAAEPGRTIGPLPMASANWFSPEPGPGIRVPGDMAAPSAPVTEPAPSVFDTPAPPSFDIPAAPPASDFRNRQPAPDFPARPPAPDFPARPPAPDFPARPPADFQGPPPGYGFTAGPAGFDVTAPQRVLGFTTPADRDMPGSPIVPGFPARGSIPDFARPAAGAAPGGVASSPDSGAPAIPDPGAAATPGTAATGSEFGTQRNLGFAAAPVATNFPAPAKPEPPGGGFAAGPAGDSASLWDLAATDVFPVAPQEPENDDAPGASES